MQTYNGDVKPIRVLSVLLTGALTLFIAGCTSAKQDKEAVRLAVIDYAKNKASLDLSHLDVQVSSVRFGNKDATAVVTFKDTSQPNAAPLEFTYNLESEGDKWVVKGKGAPVGSTHSPGMPAPEGSPANQPPSDGKMPPGHPPVGGAAAPSGTPNRN